MDFTKFAIFLLRGHHMYCFTTTVAYTLCKLNILISLFATFDFLLDILYNSESLQLQTISNCVCQCISCSKHAVGYGRFSTLWALTRQLSQRSQDSQAQKQ